ncbi:hypothetical protein [Namhaeicola litoreus]|uniref:Acetyltransferase (GNAT) domain-containing protein n=1 Tax=Namhaeicola litoreus TaxID=1052145 RepID=A0ABW3Y626_9FLAO
MLIEVDQKEFKNRFPKSTNPFITQNFLDLNAHKVEDLIYLIENKSKKIDIGLVVGLKNNTLLSPFSAPFGGFHFRHENIQINEIEKFLDMLGEYLERNGLNSFKITLPPTIYCPTFNAKVIHTFLQNGFNIVSPEITSWVNLEKFTGIFSDSAVRTNCMKAIKNGLEFKKIEDDIEKEIAYQLIVENRRKFNRPIFMTFKDIMDTAELWPIDFFKVTDQNDGFLASAIFYRSHPTIIYAAFWGDTEDGRQLCAMDMLSLNLWNYYKNLNYAYIDFGISTENSVPNQGLIRFKEIHDAESSNRFSFILNRIL